MKKILFLDDDATRHARFRKTHIGEDVTYVWGYHECVEELESGTVFDVAQLDHDLSEEAAMGKPPDGEKTGTDVAKYIAAMPEEKRPKLIVIHSFNRYGALRMAHILRDAGVKDLIIEPFGF